MFKNVAILFCLLFFLTSCSEGEDANKKGHGDRASKVRVWNATSTDYSMRISAVGTLEPEDIVILSAEVPSTVTDITRDEGSKVNKGTVIAVLERETFELAFESARVAFENAEKTFERMEELKKEDLVSQKDYDDARHQRDSTKAKYKLAKRDYENSVIKSPLKGFVSERFVSKGSFVSVGAKLFTVVDTSSLKVSVPVPDAFISELKTGLSARLKVSGFNDETFIGEVYFVSPIVDEASRTIEVKARLSNKDFKLKPGLFTDVDIITGVKEGVFVVPENAVVADESGNFIFAVVDDKAVKQDVHVVIRREGKVVIGNGIADGDVIIIDGAQGLKQGAQVQVLGAFIKE